MYVLLQEGVEGVHARIQSLEPDELGVYEVADDHSVPTTDITASVPPPTAIRYRNRTSLLTAEVWFYPLCLFHYKHYMFLLRDTIPTHLPIT